MQHQSDAQLLRDYAAHGSEPAFAEIVARHTDLVYSAALRQTGSPELAREIAQSVFTDLARKARALADTLSADASLAGWLFRGTRFAGLKWLRDDHRRQTRERQFMEHFNPTAESTPEWERVAPVLDEAMAELDDADHEAVLLRHFQNQDFHAVGRALGVSDDTAQKRVSRAVECLREFLAKRGVTVGGSGLVVLISANGVLTAPAGLSAAIAAAVVRITAPTLLGIFLALIGRIRKPHLLAGLTLLVALMVGLSHYRESSGHDPKSASTSKSSPETVRPAADAAGRQRLFGNSQRLGQTVVDGPDAMADLLPSIFRDWQKRQERAPVVRYHLAGKRVWSRGSFAPDPTAPKNPPPEDNPAQDVVGSCRRITLFDFPRNRFRVEFDNEEYDNLHRQPYRIRCLEVGDGSALRVNVLEDSFPRPGDNRAKTHVDFWIATGDPQLIPPGVFGYGYEALFFAAGIVPAKDVRIRPTALVPTNDLAAFSCEDRRSEGNTQYKILHEGNKDYWVDLERDSAIVKMILKEQAAPRVVCEIDYQQTSGGWLPRGWTRTEFVQGKMASSERVEVERVDVLPLVSDEDFVLEATPGMYVKDQRYFLDTQSKQLKSDSAHYRLESDGRKTYLTDDLAPLER